MSRERPRVCISTSAAPRRATTSARRRLVAKAADVVDDRGAALERRIGDGRLVGIDGRWESTRGRRVPRSPAARAAVPRPRSAAARPGASTRHRCRAGRHHQRPCAHRPRWPVPDRSSIPPSENESGVTLMMPITSVRAPSWSRRPPGSGTVTNRRRHDGASGKRRRQTNGQRQMTARASS